MQHDPLVHDITSTGGIKFIPSGGSRPTVIYTFMVGDNGPFRLEYDQGKDSTEQFYADVAARVKQLREVGAIK